jgi:hypothetical protein
MSYSSSTLYNGLFIVNGNVLMGNNTPITSTATYPSSLTQLIYSGDDTFNGNGSRYWAATNLALQAQSIVDPGGKAWGSRILLEGAKEGLGAASRSNGAIQFITGGSEKLRVSDNGLYIFSGNVPVRLQTDYNPVSPFDCNFEININYDKLTNTIDGVPYGTASLQVNANQVSGGYISMATGLPNTVPTEVARVTGRQMNVLSISTGSLSVGNISTASLSVSTNVRIGGSISTIGNITATGIFTGNGSGLTDLVIAGGISSTYVLAENNGGINVSIDPFAPHHMCFPDIVMPSTTGVYMIFCYQTDNNPQIITWNSFGSLMFHLAVHEHPIKNIIKYVVINRFRSETSNIVICTRLMNPDKTIALLGFRSHYLGINDNVNVSTITMFGGRYWCLDFDYNYDRVGDSYPWKAMITKIL